MKVYLMILNDPRRFILEYRCLPYVKMTDFGIDLM